MHEASKEYKYNRAAFDHKARSMTEKYARAGESESATGGQGSQSHTNQSTLQSEMNVSDVSLCENEYFVSHKRFSGSSRKLSLECSGLIMKSDSGKRTYDVPENQMDVGLKEGNKEIATECNRECDNLQVTRDKYQQKFYDVSNIRNADSVDIEVPKQGPSAMETRNPSMDYSVSLLQTADNHKQEPPKSEVCKLLSDSKIITLEKSSEQSLQSLESSKRSIHCVEKLTAMPPQTVSQSSSHNGINLYKNPFDQIGNGSAGIRRMRLGLVRRKPSLGPLSSSRRPLEDNKENQAPFQTLPPSQPKGQSGKLPLKPLDQLRGSNNQVDLHSEKSSTNCSRNLHLSCDDRYNEKQQSKRVHDEESAGGFIQQEELLPVPETVIVSDSEDSEDENISARSKLSLARKCLSRKRKGSH
ncbi:Hypothetical predicted protein [Olea europaea subsp. europaea]|nr:Hypothetical predicted protein [Olea europaea subsp. europaea]